MTNFVIQMTASTDNNTYGITHRSTFVYRVAGSTSPTRIVAWSNLNRPNPRDGQPVEWTKYGKKDGGNGAYLDPQNNATDSETTVLITPEAGVISAHGNGTGTAASGQVYATQNSPIRTGDVLALVYPDGNVELRTVRLTSNGHGVATQGATVTA
jgi:hypothetical protein